MKLNFNDYASNLFSLDNGIGLGDPLSMLLYLYYNADLLDMAKGRQELVLGYVDDIALVMVANMFSQMHVILENMMERWGSGFQWASSQNSRFETTKSVVMDFSCSRMADHPPLVLQGSIIRAQKAHKFLGVLVDQELRW